MLFHDSHSEEYRSPLGAIPAGGALTIRFWCDESDTVILRTWDGQEHQLPMTPIGGDRFGNRERLLPEASGRTWYECDVNYAGGYRGAERVLYSSDGLIYYTDDHYESFTPLYEFED